MNDTNSLNFSYYGTVGCVPWNDTEARGTVLTPFVRSLGHDDEIRICTQCGQDGILRAIFWNIGFASSENAPTDPASRTPPYFVEFGARKPHMLNSAWLREHCGWRGLLMDFQPGGTIHGGCGSGCVGLNLVENEFITAENVNQVFDKYDVPENFDLLTIDIDFNDYWVWKALLEKKKYRPRVVALDYNADLDLDETLVVAYNPKAEWDGTRYTTGSLYAYYLLAQEHGYEYIYNLEMGSHVFFVRRDLLHPDDWNLPIRAVNKLSHKTDHGKRQFVDTLLGHFGGSGSDGTSGGLKSSLQQIEALKEKILAKKISGTERREDLAWKHVEEFEDDAEL